MNVPFLDLPAQYQSIKQEIDEAIAGVVKTCRFIGGPELESFEKEFAAFCGAPYAVGCSSGTSALHVALLALGVGPGDEVITVVNTFTATAEAIVHAGATPVFVDVREDSRTMDPAAAAAAVTKKTKAIIPVHLHGQCADMDPLLELAARHGLKVIEDACQSHDAEYKGRRCGSLADAACFSFYPGKNLGAYGDGGALTTRHEAVYRKAQMLIDHGREGKYEHPVMGYNYRLDALQAAILRVKLRHLPAWTRGRQRAADLYRAALAGEKRVGLQAPMAYSTHVYHHFVIRVADRDGVQKRLQAAGVPTVIHYPVCLHKQGAYRGISRTAGSLAVSEKLAGEILSLPMFPELTKEQVAHIAKTLGPCLA